MGETMSENDKLISSDLSRVDKLKDKDIDYSDCAELDDSFLEREVRHAPNTKNPDHPT